VSVCVCLSVVFLVLMHGYIFQQIFTKFGRWLPYTPWIVMAVESDFYLVQLISLINLQLVIKVLVKMSFSYRQCLDMTWH